jgi:hypothetical protein
MSHENKRRRPSVALLLSILAVVVALSGTAYAVNIAPKNSVVSRSIKNGQVRTADVAAAAVTGQKVKDGSIRPRDIAAHSLGGQQLIEIEAESSASDLVGDADGTANGGDHGVVAATANCPPGSSVISGGSYWTSGSVPSNEQENNYIHSSMRFGNGWRTVGFVDMGSQGQVRLVTVVYCLPATAGSKTP